MFRNRYSLWKQLEVVLEYENELNHRKNERKTNIQKRIAKKYNIHQSMVIRWHRKKDKILEKAKSCSKFKLKNCKKLGHGRASRFPQEEDELYALFQDKRKRGEKVGALWFKIQFKMLLQKYKHPGYDTFIYSHGWFYRFKKRYKIALRRRTNKKRMAIENRRKPIQFFHQKLHQMRNCIGYVHQSQIYGRPIQHLSLLRSSYAFCVQPTYNI